MALAYLELRSSNRSRRGVIGRFACVALGIQEPPLNLSAHSLYFKHKMNCQSSRFAHKHT